MKANELLKHFKNQSDMARAFGVERQSVAIWIESDMVPDVRQYQAEMIVGGKLKAALPADRRKVIDHDFNVGDASKKRKKRSAI